METVERSVESTVTLPLLHPKDGAKVGRENIGGIYSANRESID